MKITLDKIAINNETLDRRVKISSEQKFEVIKLRKEGYSMRQLERIFGVSRRLIQFIIYPERLAKVNYSGHYKLYYDKDKHTEAMRKHRAYKKELINKGLIN